MTTTEDLSYLLKTADAWIKKALVVLENAPSIDETIDVINVNRRFFDLFLNVFDNENFVTKHETDDNFLALTTLSHYLVLAQESLRNDLVTRKLVH